VMLWIEQMYVETMNWKHTTYICIVLI
jgi:hypothetical protein